MAAIFISHSSLDAKYVQELSRSLIDAGNIVHSDFGLTPGSSWQTELAAKLREADAVVVVVSESSVTNQWVMSEVGSALAYAQSRGRPLVLPVVLGGIEIPGPLRHVLCVRDEQLDASKVAKRIAGALAADTGRRMAQAEVRAEQREHLQAKAPEFIRKLREDLIKRQGQDQSSAQRWYMAGYATLIAGVVVAIGRIITLEGKTPEAGVAIEFAVLSVIAVGLLVAVSRYAFMLGKAYMTESLRSAERLHAIAYGELYLSLFPDKLDWEEIKEAFEDWNIDRGSTFLSQDGKDYDPRLLETAVEIAKVLSERTKKSE